MTEIIRLKLKHFLLQQSEIYRRSLSCAEERKPAITRIARELAKKVNLSERRLQRLLSEEDQSKELSITVEDIVTISALFDGSASGFFSYVIGEPNQVRLTESQRNLLEFFAKLHEGHRRSFNMTIFSNHDFKKSEQCLEASLLLYKLDGHRIRIVREIIDAFLSQSTTGI